MTPPEASFSTNAQPESRTSFLAVWAAIRKGWIILTVTTLGCGCGALFFTMGQTKIYEAQATILFDAQTPQPLGKDVQAVVDLSGDYLNKKEYYRTQFWVIQSQRIATLVVQQLGLHRDSRFLGNLPPGAKPTQRTATVDDAARILRGNLTVEAVRDSRLAIVKYQDADPTRAQRIVNALVDAYTRSNMDETLDTMTVAGEWLDDQVQTLRQDLESSELALHGYKKDKNILSVSMDDQSNMLRGEIQQLNAALTSTRSDREKIGARRAELLKINPEEPSNVPATELLSSPLLQKLRSDYVTAVTERDRMLATGKGSNHPAVAGAQAQIDVTRRVLLEEVKNVQGAVEHEYSVATSAMNGLHQLLEGAKQRALDLNLLEIEYNRLKRNKENSEKLYGVVTERSKENDLTRMLRFNNLRVVDRAQLPKRPVSPNLPANVAGGLAAGLLLGLIGIVGRIQLDRSIKTPDDAERELGLSVLGLIPLVSGDRVDAPYQPDNKRARRRQQHVTPANLSRPELVVHTHPTSGIAEAARSVRTNILFMSPDKPFKTLLVTSAAPAEGKTTVACCIAIAMAQAGKRVVLVDCDMRRPRIHKVFGIKNELGVTMALLDRAALDQSVQASEVPNLSVLSTGPVPPNPAELLHSAAFEGLLNDLRDRFDSIVIDSPPIAPVTDAAILSTRVDGTVLVVRALQTRKDVGRRAVKSLRDVGGRLVGTVLNAVNFERREYGYYQYYYYKNSGYGPDEADLVGDGDPETTARPNS